MIIAVYRLLSVLALFPRYRAQTFSVGAVCQRLTANKEPEKVNMTRYKSRAQFPTRVLKIDVPIFDVPRNCQEDQAWMKTMVSTVFHTVC